MLKATLTTSAEADTSVDITATAASTAALRQELPLQQPHLQLHYSQLYISPQPQLYITPQLQQYHTQLQQYYLQQQQ